MIGEDYDSLGKDIVSDIYSNSNNNLEESKKSIDKIHSTIMDKHKKSKDSKNIDVHQYLHDWAFLRTHLNQDKDPFGFGTKRR